MEGEHSLAVLPMLGGQDPDFFTAIIGASDRALPIRPPLS